MSNEIAKIKNSTRRHRDESAIKRQIKIAKQHGFHPNTDVIRQPHRLAKHHALNCGDSNCVLCGNPRKVFKELTAQEKRFYQDIDNVNDKHSNGLPKKE